MNSQAQKWQPAKAGCYAKSDLACFKTGGRFDVLSRLSLVIDRQLDAQACLSTSSFNPFNA